MCWSAGTRGYSFTHRRGIDRIGNSLPQFLAGERIPLSTVELQQLCQVIQEFEYGEACYTIETGNVVSSNRRGNVGGTGLQGNRMLSRFRDDLEDDLLNIGLAEKGAQRWIRLPVIRASFKGEAGAGDILR